MMTRVSLNNYNTNRAKILIIIGFLIIVCFIFNIYVNGVSRDFLQLGIQKKNTINILYWTKMFGQEDFYLGLGSEIFQNCFYQNCYATSNRSYLSSLQDFDAVLFHAVEYHDQPPKIRSGKQIYIFSNQESPIHTPGFINKYDNFYNWTMTYRLDSDILRPYGFIRDRARDDFYVFDSAKKNKILSKPRLVAWMVSNCFTSSKREAIVKNLSTYDVDIDIYGLCGSLQCFKNTSENCYEMIEANYKFYLSFENSMCEDYVTEKLYNILKYDVVPIVYGGANYKKIAPPNSVINVADFESVESLAKYIKYLDKNPEEYLKFFEWKKKFTVDTGNSLCLCTLCQKLNEYHERKVYENIEEWWRGKNEDKCRNCDKDALSTCVNGAIG